MSAYLASTRPFIFHSPLGPDALLVAKFEGTEGVSTPYRFEIELLSEDDNIDFTALVGQPAALEMRLGPDASRYVHGIIRYFAQGSSATVLTGYKAELVPWFSLLHNKANCRIFQEKTVPEIIQQVFDEAGITVTYNISLEETYEPREYCVQYRETDAAFVSRLMEEEGIYYFFEHAENEHTMVLGDHTVTHPESSPTNTVRYGETTTSSLHDDLVMRFIYTQSIRPGSYAHTGFNFEQPDTNLLVTEGGGDEGHFEIFDYPGKYVEQAEGERIARIRLQEQRARKSVIKGRSECRFFTSGYRFNLTGHARSEFDDEYLLTQVMHKGSQRGEFEGSDQIEFEYFNDFQCIPYEVPFRPASITKRPRIRGVQSAIVVGPEDEEIHVDEHSRVKVHFHWDREGAGDEDSSCWIRVAQMYAGAGWGGLFIPRIGQEVLVNFLEGDPDRPIIVGGVYNGNNPPPYDLPAEKTKSTIKSNSSKGGEGCNEIRFDDEKGEEEFFIHGEKDLDFRVKNDRKEWVGNDRHLIVKRDKYEEVERDKHVLLKRDKMQEIRRDHNLKITGKEAIEIGDSQSVTVTGDVIEVYNANHSEEVSGDYYVKGSNVVIEAMSGLTIKAGASFITIDSSGVSISGTQVKLNSGGAALSGSAGSAVAPAAPLAAIVAGEAAPGMSATEQAAHDAPTHQEPEEEDEELTWIEIELLDEEGNPIAGERYRITLADGTTVAQGRTGADGLAKVTGIEPGSCKITFPDLDKDGWEPA